MGKPTKRRSSGRSGRRTKKRSALVDTRVIYCGDNLEQLKALPDRCVDLVYIDPPFNSNRNYEVFWGETRERRAFADRHASTQAYIEFMRPRCVELHRVLKETGSFYYHCDWHASHYVKVMLDQVFGENQFQNEIAWKRQTAHSDAKRFGIITESVFFYAKSKRYTWNVQYTPYDEEQIKKYYRYTDADGKRFRSDDLTAPGGRGPEYEFKGVVRNWRYTRQNMHKLDREGRIFITKKGMPRLKRYLDEMPGIPLQNLWTDILPIVSWSGEGLGYPTQKPLALLERIINASSNKGDIVLDAFCGCGTALVAAENLGRQWIGVDISPTACRVMAKRLRDVCGIQEDEALWKVGRGFVARGLPWTEAMLKKLPPFEFENWAVIALGGIPNKTQVGDEGIDGRIFPVAAMPKKRRKAQQELAFMDDWYPVQVKQKDKVGRPDIDAFETAMQRAERKKAFFVAFDYTRDAEREIDRFFKKTGNVIVPLTVKEILEEHIARKLA